MDVDGRPQVMDLYSQHEALVLNSLDVKVGVDVLTSHISAEWR